MTGSGLKLNRGRSDVWAKSGATPRSQPARATAQAVLRRACLRVEEGGDVPLNGLRGGHVILDDGQANVSRADAQPFSAVKDKSGREGTFEHLDELVLLLDRGAPSKLAKGTAGHIASQDEEEKALEDASGRKEVSRAQKR